MALTFHAFGAKAPLAFVNLSVAKGLVRRKRDSSLPSVAAKKQSTGVSLRADAL
jgi:hypothetical protein